MAKDEFSGDPGIVAALKALTAADRAAIETDISVREIRAYHAGEMDGDERESMRERLSLNPTAARLVADLALFPDIVSDIEEDPSVGDSEAIPAKDAMQIFEDRFADEISTEAQGPKARPVAMAERPRSSLNRLALSLAAALTLVIFGLVAWNASLQKRLAELEAPQGNFLAPTLAIQRDGPVDPVVLRPGYDGLILFLVVPEGEPGTLFEARVEQGGQVLWRHRGLVVDDYGQLSLGWPKGRVGAGEYSVSIYPASADATELDEPRARYQLRLVDNQASE